MGIYATRCLIVLGLLLLPFSPFASGQSALADRARDVIYFSVVPKKNFDQQIQELSPLLDAGLAAVSDKDYQAIHDIVSMQSRK